MPEFPRYYWGSIERVRCPIPCVRDHASEAEAQICYDSCPRHPKPPKEVERVSAIVTAKGEPIKVVEYEEPDSDATGQP